ncbi:RNA-binding motif protein, X-linked 2, partial [Gonapodya sp. JEL0774]
VVKEIQRINARELDKAVEGSASWHDEYRNSAWVFAGGLDFEFSEGDIICIFSQYGEIVDLNLVRDKATGKSRGFCFICYEDQRSAVLAVDNFNGVKIAGRTIRVDHVKDYKPPQKKRKLDKDGNPVEEEQEEEPKVRVAPMGILPGDEEIMEREGLLEENSDVDPDDPALKGLDPEDPMYQFIVDKIKKKK